MKTATNKYNQLFSLSLVMVIIEEYGNDLTHCPGCLHGLHSGFSREGTLILETGHLSQTGRLFLFVINIGEFQNTK